MKRTMAWKILLFFGIGAALLTLLFFAQESSPTRQDASLTQEHPDQFHEITVYKSQSCGCCSGYVTYLKKQGFQVTVKEMEDLDTIKDQFAVPQELRSCHTATVGSYFIEGHVPGEAIQKLIADSPNIRGLALAGMPTGSPGMGGTQDEPFTIIAVTNGEQKTFMTIGG